jgi:cell filamentation protein
MPLPSRDDHYRVTGNAEAQYMDDAQTVLKNKKGITAAAMLQDAEEEALGRAYGQLIWEIGSTTPLTCYLIRRIHAIIFGELYDWAGRWRSVWISKPGVTWPAPDFLEEFMSRFEGDVLAKYPARAIHSDESFCRAAAEIQGEFLVIHPFREGNARTIKVLADLLASQTKRPILKYDQSQAGAAAYIAAAKAAFDRDYMPLEAVISSALQAARAV